MQTLASLRAPRSRRGISMLWAPNYCEPSRPEGQDVEAPGSAVAGPATAPRPSPRFLRPSQLDSAGLGSPGLRLQGAGGRALESAKWGVTWVCPGCASGTLQFQRSGEDVVVYTEPCYSPVLSRGPSGPSPVAGLEAVPPQMYGTRPRRPRVLGGRSRQAGSSRGTRSQRVRRPRTAQRPC